MILDLARPIASLCELAGVTKGKLARVRILATQSIKDGPNVGLTTLQDHAKALGYRIEVRVVKVGAT